MREIEELIKANKLKIVDNENKECYTEEMKKEVQKLTTGDDGDFSPIKLSTINHDENGVSAEIHKDSTGARVLLKKQGTLTHLVRILFFIMCL